MQGSPTSSLNPVLGLVDHELLTAEVNQNGS